MKPRKYISLFEEEFEIWYRTKRTIPDMEAYLYRFQIYVEDNAFGYDFTISERNIERYKLNEDEIIDICFNLTCGVLDTPMEEYCSVQIGKNDIVEYLMSIDASDRVEEF